MKTKLQRAGAGVLIFGVTVLITGIIMGLTVGTYLVPVCLSSSIIINSIGVMMLNTRKK